jgi:hypothetical protein
MARTTFTNEELLHAWAQARLCTWPATFEETMADAARSRIVQLAAMRLARGEQVAPPPVVKRPAVVRPDLHAPAPALRTPSFLPAHLDRKRAAAGDDE